VLDLMPPVRISEAVRALCWRHRALPVFAATLERLGRVELPIVQFVEQLDGTSSWSPLRRDHFFGVQDVPRGPGARLVGLRVPGYEAFLQATSPRVDWEAPCQPGLLIHDLIGHLLLAQPTTPRGEIVACAGAAGFSWEAGADYFVNALLMFSLGLPLFEDVVPGRCQIDSALASACDSAWTRGRHLCRQLAPPRADVIPLTFLLVEQWTRLRADPHPGGSA
jgi:hypothetical protein